MTDSTTINYVDHTAFNNRAKCKCGAVEFSIKGTALLVRGIFLRRTFHFSLCVVADMSIIFHFINYFNYSFWPFFNSPFLPACFLLLQRVQTFRGLSRPKRGRQRKRRSWRSANRILDPKQRPTGKGHRRCWWRRNSSDFFQSDQRFQNSPLLLQNLQYLRWHVSWRISNDWIKHQIICHIRSSQRATGVSPFTGTHVRTSVLLDPNNTSLFFWLCFPFSLLYRISYYLTFLQLITPH